MTVTLETQYDLIVEAESQSHAIDVFADIEKANQVEELALEIYSYNPYEISSIEEIK
jgi:hypothetical protein